MNYVLSDIHGDYEKYRQMLELINFSDNDILYVLGDVIDRGKNSIKILLDMMSRMNVIPLVGNHELISAICLPWMLQEVTKTNIEGISNEKIEALNEWIINGGTSTLRELESLSIDEREAVLDYIKDMELYAELEVNGQEFVLCHSGIDNFQIDKPLDEYTPLEFLFARPNLETHFYSDKTVIFGHTPTQILCGEDRIFTHNGWIDIDCGCGWNGKLGCLRLDDMQEFYV